MILSTSSMSWEFPCFLICDTETVHFLCNTIYLLCNCMTYTDICITTVLHNSRKLCNKLVMQTSVCTLFCVYSAISKWIITTNNKFTFNNFTCTGFKKVYILYQNTGLGAVVTFSIMLPQMWNCNKFWVG